MRRGFTLAEVLIALMFVSIAIFGYVGLHIRLMYSGEKMQERETHRELAGCQVIDGVSRASTDPASYPPVESGPPGLRKVKQTVTWHDRNGTQTMTVETWVHEVKTGW